MPAAQIQKFSLNENVNNKMNVILPESVAPPDFDMPCFAFKSSFARSLSLTNNNSNSNNNNSNTNNKNDNYNGTNISDNRQTKSLDYDIKQNDNNEQQQQLLNGNDERVENVVPPPLPQKKSNHNGRVTSPIHDVNNDVEGQQQQQQPPALPIKCLSRGNAQHTSHGDGGVHVRQLVRLMENGKLETMTQFKAATATVDLTDQQPVFNKSQNITQEQFKLQQQQPSSLPYIASKSPKPLQQTIANIYQNGHQQHKQQQHHQQHQHTTFRRNSIHSTNVEQNHIIRANNYNNDETVATNHHHHHHPHHNDNNVQQQQQFSHTKLTNIGNGDEGRRHSIMCSLTNDHFTSVETVILQNQIDSLQWKVKKMETSCNMYRALAEEMSRFLERYQTQKQQQQQYNITTPSPTSTLNRDNNNSPDLMARSKSLYQVHTPGSNDKSNSTATEKMKNAAASYDINSSINLMDDGKLFTNGKGKLLLTMARENGTKDQRIGMPTLPYGDFKDHTWRRTPKKLAELRLQMHVDDVDEKLNQEASRLLYTIKNVLKTSNHTTEMTNNPTVISNNNNINNNNNNNNTLSHLNKSIVNTLVSNGTSNGVQTGTTNKTYPAALANANANANTTAPALATTSDITFLRSNTMRDSRTSLRSSTDGSVHSTVSSTNSSVSSKLETDEEPPTTIPSSSSLYRQSLTPTKLMNRQKMSEDESGFSSLSSFDVGLPLSSTMLSNATTTTDLNTTIPIPLCGSQRKSSTSTTTVCVKEQIEHHRYLQAELLDNNDSTLKANTVGLPPSNDMTTTAATLRYDANSKTYHSTANNRLQRFSTLSNDDSNVLWV